MRTSRFLALALTTAVLGSSAGAVHAAPSESQRLRGMEGRSFAVTVTGLPGPPGSTWFDEIESTFIESLVIGPDRPPIDS